MPATTTRRKRWRDWLLRAVAGSPEQVADHVRHRRRAAPDRMGGALAARLRGLRAGAHRQRGPRPAPARRVRRGDGRAAPGAPRRPCRPSEAGWALQRALLEHLETIWSEPDEGIWEVRGAPPAFHLFEGDGLGGVRPRHQERREVRPRRAGRALARGCATRFTTRSARHGFDREARQLRAVLRLRAARREPAAACRWSASCRRDDPRVRGTVEAIEQRLLVDGFVLRYDTRAHRRRPAAGRGRVPRLQLLAGRRLHPAAAAGRTRARCSSACSRCATTSAC